MLLLLRHDRHCEGNEMLSLNNLFGLCQGPARLTGFDGTRRPQAASKASGSKASKAGGTTANKGCHSVGSMNPGIDQFAMSSNATENNDVEGDIDMDMEDVEHQGQGQEQGQDEQTRRLWKEASRPRHSPCRKL